jgi:hypothetical protein
MRFRLICALVFIFSAVSCGDGDSDIDCSEGKYDVSTGLCWQHPSVPDVLFDPLYEWREAIDYCDGVTLGGVGGWQLPSRDDFIDLLGGCDSDVLDGDEGYCNSCAESETCTVLFESDGGGYWSSSPVNDEVAWYVGFNDGHVAKVHISNVSDVRCVRP